ncbi:MAG: SDR family oxidoreductase, partial [Marinirhabdus sp.]
MNIILTGTTGTLGSQILYELLQHEGVEDICLLIRDKTDKTALSRLLEVLKCDNAPSAVSGHVDEHLKKIQVINQHNFFSPERFLLKGKGYCFIHSASIVNLSTNPARREKILNENLGFTKKLFSAFSGYISKFTYISTAFCIGDVGGTIDNDYHAPDKTPNYRNFYEESKYLTEKYVLEQGRTLGIPVQILRPSVLGG